MPKITEVSPQKKNPKRFNIFIDGEFAFGADEDLVVEHRLVLGKIVEKDLLEKLLFEAEIGKLLEKVYGLLNVRNRSEREVRDYLKRVSFKRKVKEQEEISETSIELLIQKLKQKGLISDDSFAKDWVAARIKKKGKIAIKLELIQKGISKEIIDQVLENTTDDQKVAEALLEKKSRFWKSLPRDEFKKKASDLLLRRGFNYEGVKEIVEKLLQKMYNTDRESGEREI